MVAAAILVATFRLSKGWVQDTCSRFLFRIFALLFSASCKGRCRIDTAYIKDGYNISVFVSCNPVLLRICRQGRPLLAPSRNNAARVGTRPEQGAIPSVFHRRGRLCSHFYSVVKERSTSRLPLGARLESMRPRKVPGRTVSDSRIASG